MGERKVLNKYYPPNFDPKAIPRMRKPKDTQYTVRLMAPFNMRCLNCGNFIYKGTKFNATKETVQGETYLGLKIFRFYIRCTRCCMEIAFKTDPKEADYVCEIGATRNFESWRLVDRLGTIEDQIAQEEAEENPMAALEARTRESRQEMDILDGLEDIKDANARAAKIDLDQVIKKRELEALMKAREQLEKEMAEDEELVSKYFSSGGEKVVRVLDDEPPEGDDAISKFLRRASNLATDILIDDDSSSVGDQAEGAGEPQPKKSKSGPSFVEETAPTSKFGSKAALASLIVRKNTAGTSNPQSKSSSTEKQPSSEEKPKPEEKEEAKLIGNQSTVASGASAAPAPAPAPSSTLTSLLGAYDSDSDS